MGETNLQGQTKRLLKTGYNTLFICQNGWAVVSLYNKNYLFLKGDILNANWDMRPIFLKVSSDFSTYYCLMSESFFYVVFNQVSGSFCDFTYSFPILTPSQEQSIQLYMWLEQIQWINTLNSNPHRQTLIKNLMHNLFLIIDAELQNRASNTPLSALPRTLQILREFGILLEKYANTHHNVSFYEELWKTIKSGRNWNGILINKKKDGTLYSLWDIIWCYAFARRCESIQVVVIVFAFIEAVCDLRGGSKAWSR